MASVLLLNSLKELGQAELKEFQWHLMKDHERISKCDMENADRLKTVDKMVACFGEEEAVTITVDILKKMNQNHLAKRLENEHKQADEAPVQKRSGAQPGASVVGVKAESGASVNAPVLTGNTFTGPVNFYK